MKNAGKISIILLISIFITAAMTSAEDEKSQAVVKSPVPKYISLNKDLGKYFLYGNGGFHADWYVGYNNCWIVKLPPIDRESYVKAFMGAKIGRAKISSYPFSWDKTVIPGKIYIAIADKPAFSSDDMYLLTESSDIPLEPLPNDSLEGINASQWFWAEIPLSRLSAEKPNYIAVWAASRYFTSSSSSPIIAAAFSDDKEENVWLNKSIKGSPPMGEDTLETPVSGIKPAIAIKLIPQNEYKVIIKGFKAELGNEEIMASFSAIGEDVRGAWIELSYDKFDWQKVSRVLFNPPYFFSFKRSELSKDMFYLRAAAVDALENTGYSKEITIPAVITPAAAQ